MLRLECLEPRTLLSVSIEPQYVVYGVTGQAVPAASVMAATSAGQRAVLPADSSPPAGAMTPALMSTAYGISSISLDGVSGTGAGQTIAIIDAYDDPGFVDTGSANFATSDLAVFDQQFHLPDPPSFTKVNETGGTSLPAAGGGWTVEESLDVEWAHALAPQANIVLVEAASANDSDMYTAVDTARNMTGVSVVSMSWSYDGEVPYELSLDSHFTTPAGHNGVTFLASTDDIGYSAAYPADSPNVVGVGGTSLYVSSGGSYVSESGWSGGGGGESGLEPQPAYQNLVQSTGYREIPDVSMDADPNTGVAVCDSYDAGASSPWIELGGTSVSCPCWAALVAVADQLRVSQGYGTMDGSTQMLPELYALPQTDFHDVTTGNNGFAAGPGYDLVTGRGTPVANLLIPGLVPSPAGTVSLSASAYAVGSAVTVTVRDGNAASCQVTVASSNGDSEVLTLPEEGSSGVFQASISTSAAAVDVGDGVLQLSPGATITASYTDADNGSGHSDTVTAQATAYAPLEVGTSSPLPAATVNQPYNAALSGAGGQGGYTWSVDPGNYTQTSSTAAPLGGGTAQGWNADDQNWKLALPFAFDFYGKSYTSLWVDSNGYLDFADTSAGYLNSDYLNTDSKLEGTPRIAVLWEDLTTAGSGNDVYVTSTSSYVAIRWAATVNANGNPANAEVVLWANGNIQFEYGAAQAPGGATIGVSAGDRVHYTLASLDGAASIPADVLLQFTPAAGLPAGLSLSSAGVISGTPAAAGSYNFSLAVTDASSPANTAIQPLSLNVAAPSVAGRYLFYANSIYDGDSDSAGPSDDAAIDTSKQALLPGQTATYANYTDSTQGINGIMVDMAGLANPGQLSAADFQFAVGNDNTPSDWTAPASAPSVTVRTGAGTGGSDRVELIWPDGAIHNQWLQVTVRADAHTGLAANDVFYFGSEPGAVLGQGYASFDDIFAVYRAIGNTPSVTPATAVDVNHDGMITFDDIFAVYRAIGGAQLNLITVPAAPATAPAAAALTTPNVLMAAAAANVAPAVTAVAVAGPVLSAPGVKVTDTPAATASTVAPGVTATVPTVLPTVLPAPLPTVLPALTAPAAVAAVPVTADAATAAATPAPVLVAAAVAPVPPASPVVPVGTRIATAYPPTAFWALDLALADTVQWIGDSDAESS